MLGGARGHLTLLSAVVAWPFVKLRIPATAVTLLALVPAGLAADALIDANWALGLLWGLLAGFMDMADGAVARATGRVSRFGGYLDSVLDRVVDILLLFGIGLGLNSQRAWLLVLACMITGIGTSYAKARAYEEVRPPPEVWRQFFERGERLTVLGLGVFAQMLVEYNGWAYPALEAALLLCAAGSAVAFVQRILVVRKLVS